MEGTVELEISIRLNVIEVLDKQQVIDLLKGSPERLETVKQALKADLSGKFLGTIRRQGDLMEVFYDQFEQAWKQIETKYKENNTNGKMQ